MNYDHVTYAMDDLATQPSETIILQPSNRDTGAGILLPILYAYHNDPEAIVGVFPSDQFVAEEGRYADNLREAYKFASEFPGFIVMLGIEPNYSEPSYGLIQRGRTLAYDRGMELCLVQHYRDHADTEMLNALQHGKCLWSASTFFGSAVLFLHLFRVLMPDVFRPIQRIADALGTSREQEVTEEVFRSLPAVSFARSVLQRSTRQLAVVPVKGVHWSDWDEERRVRADLVRYEQRRHERKLEIGTTHTSQIPHAFTQTNEGTKPWFGRQ